MTSAPAINFTTEQNAALDDIEQWFHKATSITRKKKTPRSLFYYLAGYGGSGKTTLTKELIPRLSLDDLNTKPCALTAKAARVLGRKLGIPAQTVHSLNYRYIPDKELEKAQRRLFDNYRSGNKRATKNARQEIDHLIDGGAKGRWMLRDVSELIGIQLIITDEASMLTSRHIDDLARFQIPTLYIGDPGQLDPIMSGEDKNCKPFTQVYPTPDTFLETIHRQGEGSDVLEAITKIRKGEHVPSRSMNNGFGKYGADVLDSHPEIFNWADVIVCHRHVTRRMLTRKIRALRGHELPHPVAGETVVCRLNNPALGIARGEQYHMLQDAEPNGRYYDLYLRGEDDNELCVSVDRRMFDAYGDGGLAEDVDKGRISWNKDHPPFDFGYALTVHSAQGSEWNNVIVYDDYAGKQRDVALYHRWFYTACSRAATGLLIVY